MKAALPLRYAPSLVLLALLGACASHGPSPSASSSQAPAADATSTTTTDSPWMAQRAQYMDCVQRRADASLAGSDPTKTVVTAALDACEGQLNTMHDAFRDYLGTQMVSSHGKTSARQAADRVTKDTREKARVYLTGYVDYTRYQSKSR